MFTLDNVPVADSFPGDGSSGAQLVAQAGSNGGFASVVGHDVYVQFGYMPDGVSLQWTPSVHVAPGTLILAPGLRGVRFANYVAGQAATVSAALSEPSEPAALVTAAGVSTGGGASTGGASTYEAVAAGSNNAASIKGSAGLLRGWFVYNAAAAVRFVKFYDKASAPSPGSDTPAFVLGIPAGSAANMFSDTGISFVNGIGIAMVTGIANNDNTAVTASDLIVSVAFN